MQRVGKRGEKGFSLMLVAVTGVVMIGMLGLAFDMGRMFIQKSELQTFVDASAMAAVAKLDGTSSGVTSANSAAASGPVGSKNYYNFDSTAVSNVTATFATDYTGTYDSYATASTNSTNSYRFVKVTATATLPLNFLPVLSGIGASQSISASAVAGQQAETDVANGGLVPFAPDAHSNTDTTFFGLTPGTEYTLKWGNGQTSTCAGDSAWSGNYPYPSAPDAHGFVDIGQGNGTSGIDQSIEYGGYPNSASTPSTVQDLSVLDVDPGNRGSSVFSAMAARSNQDPDQTDTTVAAYKAALAAGTANGRRVITAPIADPSTWAGNGSNAHVTIIGFGNFLLDPASTISGSSGPICATYMGPANLNGPTSGGTNGQDIYKNVLYQ